METQRLFVRYFPAVTEYEFRWDLSREPVSDYAAVQPRLQNVDFTVDQISLQLPCSRGL